MASVLMCKDKAVYNIDTEEVYDRQLLPGYMIKNPCSITFKHWFKLRYSAQTNTLARRLSGVTFGQGKRIKINETTHALSLSDSYWVKDIRDNIIFEQISPYYNSFWTGEGVYVRGSIPTLYVGGYLNKEWINSTTLCKYGEETKLEKICSDLCKACDIDVVDIVDIPNGIAVANMTNTKYMLEQADQSGRIDPDDFTEDEIIGLFGVSGVCMLLIDAIIGNGDRHAGNFGWLRDTSTGEYVKMAPLYDFDHALDTKSPDDILIKSLVNAFSGTRYSTIVHDICTKVLRTDTLDIFKARAISILDKMT